MKVSAGETHGTAARQSVRTRRRGPRTGWSAGVVLVVCLRVCGSVHAAEDLDVVSSADTSSPRTTLQSFIDSCNRLFQLTQESQHLDQYSGRHRALARRALDCLDTSDIPEHARMEYAGEMGVCIKEIRVRVTPERFGEHLVGMIAIEQPRPEVDLPGLGPSRSSIAAKL